MYKCNSPAMQPVAEDSEPTSDAQTLLPSNKAHELSGQDAAIIARIKKIRSVMDSLRLKLTVEKDNLARERLETASMFTYQSTPTIPGNFAPVQGVYSLPADYDYSSAECGWGPSLSVQDYEKFVDSHDYENRYYQTESKNYVMNSVASETYRQHLQSVEKMCQEEFDRMQKSISTLRKSRRQLRDSSIGDEISDSPANSDENRRFVRTHHRASQNKHSEKSHPNRHHTRKKINYALPDDLAALDEHRNHYYCHYNAVTGKRKYLGGHETTNKDERTQEYSGDSTETSGALWHPDGLHEYDEY